MYRYIIIITLASLFIPQNTECSENHSILKSEQSAKATLSYTKQLEPNLSQLHQTILETDLSTQMNQQLALSPIESVVSTLNSFTTWSIDDNLTINYAPSFTEHKDAISLDTLRSNVTVEELYHQITVRLMF